MILIITSKEDISTNDVIDWLRRFKTPIVRISSEEPVRLINLTLSEKKM